jgi:hypothetical protein
MFGATATIRHSPLNKKLAAAAGVRSQSTRLPSSAPQPTTSLYITYLVRLVHIAALTIHPLHDFQMP